MSHSEHPVHVAQPAGEVLPLVCDSPHSGTEYPADFGPVLPLERLRQGEDKLLFERGATAATIVDDVATPMTGRGGVLYAPRDYDGSERGPLRARLALAGSLNLAALDAARRVGPDRILTRLEALGIDDVPHVSEVGAAVVLGGVDLRPVELAAAYVALARGGTRVGLRSTPGVVAEGRAVMDPAAAEVARDVLCDGRTRALAFGSDLHDAAGRELCLKTGTSTGFRDAWAVVFDDRFTIVVWLGDPDGRATDGVSGFEGAAPVAARILAASHARLPALGSPIDTDVGERPRLAHVQVCGHTGHLPGPRCQHLVEERFAEGTVPSRTCDAHGDDGALLLPARYAEWIARVHPAGVRVGEPGRAAVAAVPIVVAPRDGARMLVDPRRGETRVPLRAVVAGATVSDVAWEVDGRAHAGATWPLSPGDHRFVAIWSGRRSEPSVVRVE